MKNDKKNAQIETLNAIVSEANEINSNFTLMGLTLSGIVWLP